MSDDPKLTDIDIIRADDKGWRSVCDTCGAQFFPEGTLLIPVDAVLECWRCGTKVMFSSEGLRTEKP
jgi:DNA-directed RNA polymerase subunit RPC12/RpoP